MKINIKNIEIRDFNKEDVQYVLDYWYRSEAGYVESLGVDSSKMRLEKETKKVLQDICEKGDNTTDSKSTYLTIQYKDKPIGVHLIHISKEDDSAIFHAHIWKKEFRRKGICTYTYPIAFKIFFYRFKLKKIIFKTPIQNIGAIRVKEKLCIRCIGEEIISYEFIKEGTKAKVFELSKKELDKLF
ncbi:MAG: hypothetical protein ABIA04_10085 [Pseudomonadota bacterium]